MRKFQFDRLERRRTRGFGNHMELSYPVPRSPSGKAYQYSPNPNALPRLFLLGDAPEDRGIADEDLQRIRRQPGPGQTVCPYSGFMDDDDEFVHFEDVESVMRQVEWEAQADVQDHLAAMARDFNSRQSRSDFFSIRMDIQAARRPRPLAIREDLLRNLECNVCKRQYAVYAIGLYCPDCGSPNVRLHFERETGLVKTQIALAEKQADAGEHEIAYRLMGNAHEDVLTAFEATMKTVYRQLIQERLPERAEELASYNAIGTGFQRIDRARKLYSHISLDPFEILTPGQLTTLAMNIQKRHIIGHNLSIADGRFAEQTDEGEIGQTIHIIGEDIQAFSGICQILVNKQDSILAEVRPCEESQMA